MAGEIGEIKPWMSIGTTGLKESSGFIDEEFLRRLRGVYGVRYYREMMDTCAIIGSILYILKALIRQTPWRIEPADESPAARREAEETEGALEDMSTTFEDFISEVLSFIPFGWAYFETIYKLRKGETDDPTTRSKFNDGKWGWRKFDIRAQDTLYAWKFDEDGGIRGMLQQDSYRGRGTVFIPIEKSILFRTETTKNNPEGKSLLRPSVEAYHYLRKIQQFEATGIERELAGMPIMEVPMELLLTNPTPQNAAIRSQLEMMVQQIRRDERYGALIPPELDSEGKPTGFKLKLLTTGGKRQIETDPVVKRWESRIAMTFFAQVLLMGQDNVGSFSLADNSTSMLATSIGSIMDIIASTFNRFAIRRRQQLNNRPQELDPVLVHGDIETPDLGKLGAYVQQLAASGMLSPNPKLERELLSAAGLPAPEDEDIMPQIPRSTETTEVEPDEAYIQPGSEEAPVVKPTEALNGAQIASLVAVLNSVATGQMPRDSAIEIITTAFPISLDRAERIMGTIGRSFSPKPIE